jgi:hypothetical protein
MRPTAGGGSVNGAVCPVAGFPVEVVQLAEDALIS